MPRKKTVIITETGPVDLTRNFTSQSPGGDSYSYNASNQLRILTRFTDQAPENVASYSSTHTLTIQGENHNTGGSAYSTQVVGQRSIDTFDADDTNNKEVILTFSGTDPHDNIITFGNGSSDSAFSVSFWVKLSSSYSASGHRYFFAKGKSSSDSEYFGFYKPSSAGAQPNSLGLELVDDSNNYIIRHQVSGVDLEDDNWHHIVMTYSGGGGSDSSSEIKFYIDGTENTNTIAIATKNNSTGYVAMEPTSEIFHIGAHRDGSTEIDGFMAEFAVWGAELSSSSAQAIYHAQADVINETDSFNSGYTNLSPRIQQRTMDNRPGCYPTKHRMGDKDRSGKNNIFYEDLPIEFGACIKDDFEDIDTPGGFAGENKFDKNKWVVSAGMSIRTERVPGNGVTLIDKCAVFSGVGTGGKRFIRSANKIINPIRFYFEVIQGPYNNTTGGLDLRPGASGTASGIKVQISTDVAFASPINISTIQLNSNQREFYGIDDNDAEDLSRPRKRVYLDLKDFSGLTEPYYFRFVQESYDIDKNNWAISKIEIDYANQAVRAPLLLNHGSGNEKFVSASLTTPHTDSDLLVTGRSVSGISDVVNPFQDFTETVTPFNETLAVENNNSGFFNEGLDSDVYPGFTSPTRSKTKFTIDLSVSEETTFGYDETAIPSTSDESGYRTFLMTYWNNVLKRWEKIGTSGLGGNTLATIPAGAVDYFNDYLKKAALGFGPVGQVVTGSPGNMNEFMNNDYLAAHARPIDSFLFPFGNQYVATASNYILAKDIGITKPFLLEKTSLSFESKFELPGSLNTLDLDGFTDEGGDMEEVFVIKNTTAALLHHTFFLLRQHNDNFIKSFKRERYRNDFREDTLTLDGTSRELISYKQLMLLYTGSANTLLNPPAIDYLDTPIARELNIIIDNYDPATANSLTGSFLLNGNVKTTAPYRSGNKFTIRGQDSGLMPQNFIGGRSHSKLNQISRGVVNIAPGEGEKNEINLEVGSNTEPYSITTSKNMDLTSPYVILPNDKLIFGWQHAVPQDLVSAVPRNTNTAFATMTLFGKSKLHLYGSEVVENKEFHETVNQNLTSCAVYEHIIGDEKVVDQWQVAYRGELSGSNAGQSIFNYNSAFDNGNSETWNFAFNNDWTLDAINSSTYTNVKVHEILNKSHPKKRIGSRIVQGGRSTIFNLWKSIGQSDEDANSAAAAYSEYLVPIRLYITTRDQDRVYSDSNVVFGELFNQSTYGGINAQAVNINNLQKHPFFLSTQANTSFYAGTKPQYIFKSDHFGYYADMLRQGLDSKFKVSPRQGFTTGFDIIVNSESPVRVKFVSGTTQEGPTLRAYTEKNVDAYLDEKIFQSSNLSTTATSSIPFIDDNQPRNRNYIETEFIAVPLF